MEVKVLVFGACRDIIKSSEIRIDLPEDSTTFVLRKELESKYPALTSLKSLLIAVNNSYSSDKQVISFNDEVALIPPVSGG